MRAATILALASMAFLSTPITALPNPSPSDPNLLSRQITQTPCNIVSQTSALIELAGVDLKLLENLLKNLPLSNFANSIALAQNETMELSTALECPPSDTKLLRRQATESPCEVLAGVNSSLSQAETAINTLSSLPLTPTESELSVAVTNIIRSSLKTGQIVQHDAGC